MKWTEDLNHRNVETRLSALRGLKTEIDEKRLPLIETSTDVNNHIHTIYSFSPYSPTMAVWRARQAGLCTAGIVDHDSVSGVREFLSAGEIIGLPVTSGLEVRVTHSDTAIGMRKTNHPDQGGISYLTLHGIPERSLNATAAFLKPIRMARGVRNRRMFDAICRLTDTRMDYTTHVLPLSMAAEGGSVTERHLLYALALHLIATCGRGESLRRRLAEFTRLSPREEGMLMDVDDPWYDSRLLGIFKANLVEDFYIPAGREECPDIRVMKDFADDHDIILTYPYLGDVGESPTGDKKAQSFEDAYLDLLFTVIDELKFRAVSYMPSRNTPAQLKRLRRLCEDHGMLQITGEDINTPFQSFVCPAQRDPSFSNLYDSTWALIGHERAASANPADSFLRLNLPLEEKVEHFKRIAHSSPA
jgi:hypothetical protein